MADRIRLLYVDDDSQSLAIRAEILESQHGMTVRTETNVERGLERIAETRVDCVLSDLQMPERDGIDFLRAVRTLYPDLPFILFTSRESEGIANRALAIGATDYLPKSVVNISYSLLADRIEKAIEIHDNRIERRSEADVFSDGGNADDAHADRKPDAEAEERIDAPNSRLIDEFIWLGWPIGEHSGRPQARGPPETVASAGNDVGADGPTVAVSDDAVRAVSDDAVQTEAIDSVAAESDRSEDKWKAATATDTDHERHPIDDAGGAFVFELGADETEVDQSIERPAIERPAIEEIEDRPNGSDSPTDGPSSVRTNGTPTETERRDAFSEEELARLIRNMIRSELKRDRTRANSEEPDDEARIEADRHVKADRRTGTETQGGQIDPINSDRDPIDSDRDHGRQTADRIDDGWSAIKRTDNDERTTIDNDERTTIDNDERTTIDNDERTTI
ncbi:MAG: response regulator, partial [Halobacteriota archaeon]